MERKMELVFLFVFHCSVHDKMMKTTDFSMQMWKIKEMLFIYQSALCKIFTFFKQSSSWDSQNTFLLTLRKMENEGFFFLSVHIWK